MDLEADEYWGWTKYQYATESKYRTEKLLYKKHICGLGFFSRYHARRTITLLLGVDTNLYIHTIKGKNLIKQGITDLPKKGHQSIFFKGKPTKIRRFIFPAEARMDKHRRRHFVVRMNKIYKKHGRRAFNRAYQIALYGYRDESHLNIESKRDYRSILLSYRRYNKLSQGEKNQFNLDCLNHPPRIWQIALFLTKVYHIKFNRILFKKAYDFLDDFGEASLKFQNQVIIQINIS